MDKRPKQSVHKKNKSPPIMIKSSITTSLGRLRADLFQSDSSRSMFIHISVYSDPRGPTQRLKNDEVYRLDSTGGRRHTKILPPHPPRATYKQPYDEGTVYEARMGSVPSRHNDGNRARGQPVGCSFHDHTIKVSLTKRLQLISP